MPLSDMYFFRSAIATLARTEIHARKIERGLLGINEWHRTRNKSHANEDWELKFLIQKKNKELYRAFKGTRLKYIAIQKKSVPVYTFYRFTLYFH